MDRKRLFSIFIMIVFLGGCTLAPKYERPASPAPKDWPKGAAYQEITHAAGTQSPADLKWRQFFLDKKLQNIIAMALENNRDLRLAVLNVERARALYGIQRAELLPSVSAVGVMSRQRIPADLLAAGKSPTTEQYGVNLGISSWEIDFFGRIQSLKDRALEEYLATEQASRSTKSILISAVAQAYLSLAANRENLRLASSTFERQTISYNLIKRRYDVGLGSELDVQRALTQVEMAKRDQAYYTQMVAQDENALNLLVGLPVSTELLPTELMSQSLLGEIFIATPSEVLLRRFDILAAEHRLKAANANIGAARAAFFPRISLTTSIGTASAELSGLFKSGSETWNFVPQIILPIFDARTWSAYDATLVEREIAVAQYEKAIQTAFRDVADSLAVRGTVDRHLSAQQSYVDALAETYRLSKARYEKGIDNYLSVLDAERSLNAAKQGLIMIRLARLTNMVTLYKVLGGGCE